ncbi:hypothetical protein SCLCIDRAFT_33064 [Scleroderma citrinum Foug A]|uniref:Uncharacterized protein n=1 Tax=Scleroderma citrinum Foug A TaxID=1036808 RepID=A0A0C3D688_9AGAM|nr:hypothetical protein SCLCIDRAFT_33064 [Scleroderma citrinum Foug A]
MASPSRRGLKRSKRSVEDATSQSKKHKAGTAGHSTHSGSNATHPHCSGRAGAGTGGHFAQLEWVGAQLKASQPVLRPLTTFPNDDNPVTPPLRKGQKKKPSQAAPPPYVSTPSVNTTGSLGKANLFFPGVPCFHPSTNGNRFGFQEPTFLVPPGTEPDLHALNNPYVAAQCEKEHWLATSQSTQTVNISGHQSQSPETIDVLKHHQQKNGRPCAPDPAMLTALHNQSTAMAEKDDNSDEDPLRKCCTCHQDRDQPVPPTQIGHYGPVWKDCLEEAKIECRAVHALSNPWPKFKMDNISLTDSLTTVVMEWNQRGVCFEPGKHLLRSPYCHNFIF